MIGQGKYDSECQRLFAKQRADVVACIVLGGSKGSGFSLSINKESMARLPVIVQVLRQVADEIERDGLMLRCGFVVERVPAPNDRYGGLNE